MARYDFKQVEPDMLSFWDKQKAYAKVKEKTKEGKDFYFLDGPPYTSGKLHLGHSWNYSMKDMVLRYKRMKGFNAWDRAGYDTHGLPTAHAVQKKFKIEHKDDIVKFGVEKFIKECINLCEENRIAMTKVQKRLGIWMDFDNPYITFKNEYMEGEWWLIKKAHENNRLYEGKKVMHWCAGCATALAKHELEYETDADDSIFLKFQVKGKDNEFLVIWTTTPWTIPYNLGVMVNPDEVYVKVKIDNEFWIVASKLAAVFIQGVVDKKYEVVEEIKGKDLEGLEYVHPLHDELKDVYDKLKSESPNVHTVVLSKEYVETTSGSGLVHMAPGCGPEDYEVGHKYKIPPFNNLNEDGSFPEEMGKYKGMVAKKDDKKFVEDFKAKGALIASTPVEHEYAHCWRCKSPVVFRTTKQWFFKVEDLKDQMRELNKNIKWQPDWAGSHQFDSWLDNLRDNSITRQRFWGTPVPIWKCEKCGNYDVIGSVKELEEKSGSKAPDNLHIPYIDEIKINCNCGEQMSRVPDILDVWVDAGTASWTCLDFPAKTELFDKLWPADFILEGKDQIRGWFNLLLVAGMVSMNKPSYKAVFMHGFINDAQGRKMSKSLGNYILPQEVIDNYGVDTLRYYMIGGANPGVDINYNFDDVKLKKRNLDVLWNLQNFVIQLSKELKYNPVDTDEQLAKDQFELAERFIFSRLNSTIEDCTAAFDDYRLNEIPWIIEKLFLDLSRVYVQLVREKSSIGDIEDRKIVLYTLYKVLLECLKMFAPVSPFISEQIYLNLKDEFKLKEESVHLFDWPGFDDKMIDKKLERNMELAQVVIQSILSMREKANLGVRWPLKEAVVVTKDDSMVEAAELLRDNIMTQTNVKSLNVLESLPGVKHSIKAEFKTLGPDFGELSPKIIAKVMTESPETILKHLDKDKKYCLKVEGKDIELKKEHLIISKEIPKPFEGVDTRFGSCYINTERSEELEAEGYSRELMRRIQSLRKNAGLQKTDRISLLIKVDEDSIDMFKDWQEKIKEKVGADKLEITTEGPAKKHEHHSVEKIKKLEFEIWF